MHLIVLLQPTCAKKKEEKKERTAPLGLNLEVKVREGREGGATRGTEMKLM